MVGARLHDLFEDDTDLEESGELVVRADLIADAHGLPQRSKTRSRDVHTHLSGSNRLKRFPRGVGGITLAVGPWTSPSSAATSSPLGLRLSAITATRFTPRS
ncbi:hypothetical protein C9J85_09375 [Haloferax sp. wsp5]|nr:hypothetical protein C9J85_09375 [Haloferax sp. wsp5]